MPRGRIFGSPHRGESYETELLGSYQIFDSRVPGERAGDGAALEKVSQLPAEDYLLTYLIYLPRDSSSGATAWSGKSTTKTGLVISSIEPGHRIGSEGRKLVAKSPSSTAATRGGSSAPDH